MNIGTKIFELRKKYSLSQEQLAEKIGVARQTISKWELGETAPDIKQARMLSQVFSVSLDELVGNETKESVNDTQDHNRKNDLPWKKIAVISAVAVCLCLVFVGVFNIVRRSQILHPQGVEGNIAITRNEPVIIKNIGADTVVFSEEDKPVVACKLPEGFVVDTEIPGLYANGKGGIIRFNADYSDNVLNPLFGTDYYSYYENRGYHSYMDMARMAMYSDLPRLGILASTEELHLAGGAQIIRQQLCAGKDADYYAISGGLTESGDGMRIYGFALHFDNTTWMITLKDYNDAYCFITVKDPDGIGRSIETLADFLGRISIDE